MNRTGDVVDPIQEDCELVAADPGDGIAGPEVVFETLGNAFQKLVTEGVAKAVVDVLETVEVEEKNGELVLRRPIEIGH